jgi:general secretion pathway protein E
MPETLPSVPLSSAAAELGHQRLGELLIAGGKLKAADLDRALRVQPEGGDPIGVILVKLGMVSEQDVAEALSVQSGIPLVAGDDYPGMPVLEGRVSTRFLKENKVVPLAESEDRILVAVADPRNEFLVNAIAMLADKRVERRLDTAGNIGAAIERLYGSGKTRMGQIVEDLGDDSGSGGSDEDIEHLKDQASEAPVIRLVNLIMDRAVDARASDIHVEPFENRLKVRYRIDGVLHEVESPPVRLSAATISRIKLMAKLNIAERRLPQDGRINIRVRGKEIDLRVSTVPTMHGESVVMRLLDKGGVVLDLEGLGFSEGNRRTFMELLDMPHGIILVTGPTGSGKTTTLYTALNLLNTPERKILTVEDPVEYQLEGVNQIQVKSRIGLTFASALRAIVRQDPDVIMIGEMRDLETAEIAVQSALTGHLVLSTLHTNDAAGSVTRMLDMGVKDYLVTSTVNGILAQRLVRTLCPHCKRAEPALPEMVEEMHLDRYVDSGPVMLYRPVGCAECGGSGFRGRNAIMEILKVSDALRRLVLRQADAGEIQRQAVKEGMRLMYEDGLRKAVQGVTTVEEVLRVTQEV